MGFFFAAKPQIATGGNQRAAILPVQYQFLIIQLRFVLAQVPPKFSFNPLLRPYELKKTLIYFLQAKNLYFPFTTLTCSRCEAEPKQSQRHDGRPASRHARLGRVPKRPGAGSVLRRSPLAFPPSAALSAHAPLVKPSWWFC